MSSALAEGPLGPCRGIALSIAARYAIPYATALLAVTPRVFGEPALRTMGAYEEIAREMEASVEEEKARRQREREEGGGGEGREGGAGEGWSGESNDGPPPPPAPALKRRGGFPVPRAAFGGAAGSGSRRRAAAPAPTDSAAAAAAAAAAALSREEREKEEEEDRDLMRLAREAGAEMMDEDVGAGALPREYSASQEPPLAPCEEDSELVQAARRYAHVGALLAGVAAAAAAAPGSSSSSGLEPWAPLAAVEHRVRLDGAGRAPALELEGTLRALGVEGARRAGLSAPPTLEDYGLTDADYAAVAEMAEVDPNTLTALAALRRSDIIAMLKES